MATLRSELRLYEPVIGLDRILSRGIRKGIRTVYGCILLFLGVGATLLHFVLHTDLYLGFFFILFGPYLLMVLLSFYYNTLYYRGIDYVTGKPGRPVHGITYGVADILLRNPDDLTKNFIQSPHGKRVMLRCGLSEADIDSFLSAPRTALSRDAIVLPETGMVTVHDVGTFIATQDKAFSDFLFSKGIQLPTYQGALAFELRTHRIAKAKRRWWSRENLLDAPGLGAEFSYGIAYQIEQYLHPLDVSTMSSVEGTSVNQETLTQIETVLARARGANILLVAETAFGTEDILQHLAKDIAEGKTAAAQSRHVMVFDTEAFVATHETKQTFEPAFLTAFSGAAGAGNIILVLKDLPKFLASAETIGSDAADLLTRYLSSELQIVATSDSSSFHQKLETNTKLITQFEVMRIENPGNESIVRILEDVALRYETSGNVVFTYAALQAVAESADRYIVEGVMPDKAINLLSELAAAASVGGQLPIGRDFVTEYIGKKTGVPVGPVQAEERDELMHLEETLHGRVIGQDAAITAIANAMRRARSGVTAADRPMGTFLFLGPTGVGKTETAKALAYVFFGDETKMVRLDMSEFSDDDALGRLIGEGETPGQFSSELREHPYGVVLLDEFEKSSKDVRNLFLQVLDEGIFTDSRGNQVNARNTIMIATSNAGAKLIFDAAKSGTSLADKKEEIIDSIIHEGIYTPELVNRFDGVIIFEPLSQDQQKQIARLMLEDLAGRVKQKGFTLEINDALLDYLVSIGYDAEFGARPLRRAIQDTIESKVADKIIQGGLTQGATISFTPADFTH